MLEVVTCLSYVHENCEVSVAHEYFSNNSLTTLAVAVDSSANSIQPSDPATFPSQVPFRIRLGSELMMVTAVVAGGTTTWTVTRGLEGTGATSHNPGTSIRQVLTAAALEYLM